MTTAERAVPVFPSKLQRTVLLTVLFGVFALVRTVALDADPPTGLSWSAGIFTDEGIYAVDARSVVLTGHWAQGDFHSAIITPLLHLIQLGVFRSFGVGLVQARSISVFFSLATLIVFHEAIRTKYGGRTALIGVTFLGLTVPYVLYNRLALLETPTVFVLVTAFLIWAKNGSNLVIGVLLGLAFVFKPLALLAAPAFVYASWPNYRRMSETLAGIAFAMLAYCFLWYIPHQSTLGRINHYYAFHQYWPHSWMGLSHNLKRGAWSGEADGIIPYLLHHELPLSVLAGTFMIRSKELFREDRLLTAWLIVPIAVFMVLSYSPSRYFVLFWPPLAALAALGLRSARRQMAMSVVGLYMILCLAQMYAAWSARADTVRDGQIQLKNTLQSATLVAGQFAPILCLQPDDRLTALYVQPGLANERQLSPSEEAVVVLVTRSSFWNRWWHAHESGMLESNPTATDKIGSRYDIDIYYVASTVPPNSRRLPGR